MTPAEVLETIAEYLLRRDLEALLLTNSSLLTFVEKRFEHAIPRHLHLVVDDCHEVSATALFEEAYVNYPVKIPSSNDEPRLRHSVIDYVDFGSLLCECVLEGMAPMLAQFNIRSVSLSCRYTTMDVATEALSKLFLCENMYLEGPRRFGIRECRRHPVEPRDPYFFGDAPPYLTFRDFGVDFF